MPDSRRKSLTLFPYLRPSPDCVVRQEWSIKRDGSDEIYAPLLGKLTNWSPGQDMAVRFKYDIDVKELIQGCRLQRAPESQIMVAMFMKCESTKFAVCLSKKMLDRDQDKVTNKLEGAIDGNSVAEKITLWSEILICEPEGEASTFTPQLPGSRLLECESHMVTLEGIGGQFPMQSVKFSSEHLLGEERKHALWHLHTANMDFNDPILGGSIKLWLNVEHPDFHGLEGESSDAITTILTSDMTVQLVSMLAFSNDEDARDSEAFGDGTIGRIAWRLAKELFGETITLKELRNEFRRSPGLLQTKAQAHARIRMYNDEEAE